MRIPKSASPLVSGAAKRMIARVFSSIDDDQEGSPACGRLLRRSGADQLAHQQPKVVAGDVDQVALVHVLPPLKNEGF
jgi:hypothetical protein